MSISSGCAISSRKPPKCGALKNSVVSDADLAEAATAAQNEQLVD